MGWAESSTGDWPLIVNSFPGTATAHSGTWAAWLGGASNETSILSQQVTIRSVAKALSFYHWIAHENNCGNDVARVLVNNSKVLETKLCQTANTNGWRKVTLNLGAYVGQTVTLKFVVVTDSSLNSNWFIDDVALSATAVAAADEAAPPPSVAPGTDSIVKGKQ